MSHVGGVAVYELGLVEVRGPLVVGLALVAEVVALGVVGEDEVVGVVVVGVVVVGLVVVSVFVCASVSVVLR